ncbi:MAG: hypothetical protein M0R80_13540 [Proteobacteria bacterium]|nr:hypothetical protein [Pseudomonadota bacterium]
MGLQDLASRPKSGLAALAASPKIDLGFDPEVGDPSLQMKAAEYEPEFKNLNTEWMTAHPTFAKIFTPLGRAGNAVMDVPFIERAGQTGAEVMTTVDNPDKTTTGSRLGDMAADLTGGLMGFTANPQSAGAKLWGGSEQLAEKGLSLIPQVAKLPAFAQTGLKLGAASIPYEATMAVANNRPVDAGEMATAAGSNALLGMLPYGIGKASNALKGFKNPKVELPIMEAPAPKVEMPTIKPTILPKGIESVKTTHPDVLAQMKADIGEAVPIKGKGDFLGEGSISAAKFTIPEKQAQMGEEKVRSFMVTGMKSPVTHPETKAGLLVDTFEGGPGGYKKQTHAMTEEGSKQFLADEGLEKSVDYVLHTTDVNAYRMGLGKEVIVKLQEQGNMSKAIDVYETLAEKATGAGQYNEAGKLFNALTPEGVGMKAAKDAKKAYDKLPAPAKQRHTKASEDVQLSFDEINKEVVEEVINKTTKTSKPSKTSKEKTPVLTEEELAPDMLAERIKQHVSESKDKEADPIKDMIDTLFKKAKEVLPKQDAKRLPRDEMAFVQEAIANKEKYRSVWDEAKKSLQAKYGDNPGIMDSVDSFIAHYINIPYSEASIGKITRAGIKGEGVDLAQIVREHYTVQTKAGNDLVKKLVDMGGMAERDAQALAMEIGTKFEQLATKKKQQILDQKFGKKHFGKRPAIDDYMIELSNLGALSKGQYRRLVAEKLGLPVFSEDMAKQLMKLANDAQTLKGRDAEIARGKMKEILSLLKPATLGQKVDSFRRIAMLLNPKTHVRNIGGNVILAAFENIKDIPGSLADMAITAGRKARGVKDATRTTLMPSIEGAITQGKGFVEGAGRVYSDVKHGVDTTPSGQYEIRSGKSFKSPIGKALEGTTNTLLKAGDVPFYQAAYRDTLRQQMKIHKVDTPTEAMDAAARSVAEHRTFQNDSDIAKGVKYLQGGLNYVGSAAGLGTKEWGLGNVDIPFVKTLGNIMDKAVDYSPVGFLSAAKHAYTSTRKGVFDQKAVVDAIGRSVVGSATILLGYDLCKAGVITGQQDKDTDVAAFNRNVGKMPYSFNMSAAKRLVTGNDPSPQKGDVIRTYDFAQPISVALAMGADIYNGIKDRKKASDMVVEAIKSGGNTLLKQSVMQGIQKMMGGYDAMQGILDTVLQTPLQFVPTLSGQVAKSVDDKTRETYSDSTTGEIGNKIKAKIPWLSKSLPARADTLGKDMPSVQGGNSIWNTYFNPSTTKEFTPSPVEQKIMDVYKATGDKTVLPRSVKQYKSFKVSGQEDPIKLTTDEYALFQKRIGEITNEKLAAVNTTDPAKAVGEINKIMDAAALTVKTEILRSRGLTVSKNKNGSIVAN